MSKMHRYCEEVGCKVHWVNAGCTVRNGVGYVSTGTYHCPVHGEEVYQELDRIPPRTVDNTVTGAVR